MGLIPMERKRFQIKANTLDESSNSTDGFGTIYTIVPSTPGLNPRPLDISTGEELEVLLEAVFLH